MRTPVDEVRDKYHLDPFYENSKVEAFLRYITGADEDAQQG